MPDNQPEKGITKLHYKNFGHFRFVMKPPPRGFRGLFPLQKMGKLQTENFCNEFVMLIVMRFPFSYHLIYKDFLLLSIVNYKITIKK